VRTKQEQWIIDIVTRNGVMPDGWRGTLPPDYQAAFDALVSRGEIKSGTQVTNPTLGKLLIPEPAAQGAKPIVPLTTWYSPQPTVPAGPPVFKPLTQQQAQGKWWFPPAGPPKLDQLLVPPIIMRMERENLRILQERINNPPPPPPDPLAGLSG
jgi:hypothetical protein